MDIIYNFLDVFSLSFLNHDFMKNALLAILLVSPIFGILGTMIVSNKMAFFSDALGHGAFTGLVIGSLVGLVSPTYGAVVFSLIFSVFITIFKHKSRVSTDTVIGVFSSTAIALGIFISTMGGKGFTKLSAYLIGDILSVTPSEILMLAAIFAIVIVFWFGFYNKLLITSVNGSLARSRGIRTLLLEMLFTSLVAVVVTISIPWVGLMVINSMLVLPAAAARNLAKNSSQYHKLAITFSMISGILGLVLSYYLNSVTGATVVLVAAIIFFLTFFAKMDRKKR